MEQVLVLGHLMSKDGIKPNPAKITAIQKMPKPSSITEVKGFLGVINFYRRFIKSCSSIADPIIDLTRGKKKFKPEHWGPDQQRSFETLKSCLINAPVLILSDTSKPSVLETDVSDVGLGAVLSQEDIYNGVYISYQLHLHLSC